MERQELNLLEFIFQTDAKKLSENVTKFIGFQVIINNFSTYKL